MRLFVAIDLPEAAKAALAAISAGVPGARWVPPENMHVTLRFVGEVAGHVCDDLVEALSEVGAEPFDLIVQGVGHFESRRQPHSLWAAVARSEGLLRLREGVEAAVQRAGIPPEGRKFTPHVTLGRLKASPPERVRAYLAEHNLLRLDPIRVTEFTLFSSHLSRSGAIYRAEADFPLGGGRRRREEEEPDHFDPWGVTGDGAKPA